MLVFLCTPENLANVVQFESYFIQVNESISENVLYFNGGLFEILLATTN